ncbi:hypothetical protein TR66_17630 [Streptomyces sp. WM6391]|nr:hypothetical protein TR66_17630 [Streptomyces sp. WM6391]
MHGADGEPMTGPMIASLVCTPLYFRRCRVEGKQAPECPSGTTRSYRARCWGSARSCAGACCFFRFSFLFSF